MLTRNFERQRAALVDELRRSGIVHEGVLAAIGRVDRHLFVEQGMQNRAYENIALPIGHGQTISQPLTVAWQTQLLNPKKGDRILEIGLGSGYQAAVLCEMGAQVFSIEYHEGLWKRATERLNSAGYRLMTRAGDGSLGWESMAPFDGILVTAGATEPPKSLMEQLAFPAGRLIVPIGSTLKQDMMRCVRVSESEYQWEKTGAFRFVPFVNG